MNDIVLTSRGGARMSEAMPNYILNGIYTLSNSYTNGRWPCNVGHSKCKYIMPYFTLQELGLSGGAFEYRCAGGGNGNNSNHPMQGSCSENLSIGNDWYTPTTTIGAVTFDFPNRNYSETCSHTGGCWAHPFMGIVPAPGRGVKANTPSGDTAYKGAGTIMAQDEFLCPPGSQAVMTVTPTLFELGKVLHYNALRKDGQVQFVNPGFQNYGNAAMRSSANILQPGTKLGIMTKGICSLDGTNDCSGANSQLYGWAVAMGTVTQSPDNSEDYIWNVGGIYANTWTATAHTYCYFNPERFNMPNMTVKSRNGINTMTTMSSSWSYHVEPTLDNH